MYVCLCKGVTDRRIREVLAAGARSVGEVMECTGAGTCCGACRGAIAELVAEAPQETAQVRCAGGGRRLSVVAA